MTPRRWWAVTAATIALTVTAPAAQAAEARSSWWNRANVGLLPEFGSPDVGEGQLLVEGVADTAEGWVAVAGLAFSLDEPVTEATLTLVAADVRPASQPPLACRLTAGFSPVAGGPWSDVPAHDCSQPILSEMTPDGARFVFRGLAPLVTGSELRVLIVPGGPGRFVFQAPGAAALEASAPSSPSPEAVGGERSDGLSPIGSPALPFDLFPPPAGAGTPAAALTPATIDPGGGRPAGAFGGSGRFEPPADDASTRAATAALLALALCAFTALQRGGNTRLRPARVSWR